MSSLSERIKFDNLQTWHDYHAKNPSLTGQDLLNFRVSCYKDIEEIRKNPLIIYFAKFIGVNQANQNFPNSIDLSDVDGFTDLVNSIKSKKVDVLLHSPGGSPDATERIVNILRNKFEEVNFLIPHSAYSAATMLALSGDSIILHPSATLGPIDPQLNGIPVRSIKNGFDKVRKLIQEQGPEALPAYIPLIEKYSIDLLELCEDSEKLSKDLVTEWLKKYMFKNESTKDQIINEAVLFFSSYDIHLLHSRPLFYEKIKNFNLKITVADESLSKLLWEAYILISEFFNMTPFTKLYETIHGVSWGRQFMQLPFPVQIPPVQTPTPAKKQLA